MLQKKVDVGEEGRCWSKDKEDETHVDGCLLSLVWTRHMLMTRHMLTAASSRSYASCHSPHLCV